MPVPTSAVPLVVGLGELLWDVLPTGKRPGGAPANVAFHACRLGFRGAVASRVGADADGRELVQFLRAHEIDASVVQTDPRHPTGRVSVEFGPTGEPDYTIHRPAAWDFLEWTDSLAGLARQAAAIAFGTLAQRDPVSRSTIRRVLDAAPAECLKVYDVNLRQNYFERDWIESSLQRAHLVKLNQAEVEVVGKLLDLPTDETAFAREAGARFDLRAVVVTRGDRGCLAMTSGETCEVAGEPVQVADPVGAGDGFTAGLIVSLLRNWPLERAARFANRVGGLVASRSGATPELSGEFAELVAEFQS